MTMASDPLTGADRLVAPHRAARLGAHGSECPFCPGQEARTPRETGRIEAGDGGWRARVFPNLYPLTEPHEVLVPTSRHVTSWQQLSLAELEDAVRLLLQRRSALAEPQRYVHAFVNDGVGAGASIAHVHAQLVVVAASHGERMMHGLHRDGCVLCVLLADPEHELRVTSHDGLALLAHPAPRLGGGLLITPDVHQARPEDADPSALAALLHDGLRALDADVARNLWLAAAGDDTHWYLELQPRSAGIAGVELALGLHVIAEDPFVTARTARRRLSAAPAS